MGNNLLPQSRLSSHHQRMVESWRRDESQRIRIDIGTVIAELTSSNPDIGEMLTAENVEVVSAPEKIAEKIIDTTSDSLRNLATTNPRERRKGMIGLDRACGMTLSLVARENGNTRLILDEALTTRRMIHEVEDLPLAELEHLDNVERQIKLFVAFHEDRLAKASSLAGHAAAP